LHAAKICLFASTEIISLLIGKKYHINIIKAGENIVETSRNRPEAFFSPEEAFVLGISRFS